MALSVFGPGIVLDRFDRPVAASVATVLSSEGIVVGTVALDGVTPQPVMTDAHGVFGQFKADPGVGGYVLLRTGGIELAVDPLGGGATGGVGGSTIVDNGDGTLSTTTGGSGSTITDNGDGTLTA